MTRSNRFRMLSLPLAAAVALSSASLADDTDRSLNVDDAPISDLLRSLPEDVQLLNQHLTTLADPFMEGRLPGTFGMEVARRYMEHYFEKYGLEPGFEVDGEPSWRQAFELGSTEEVSVARFAIRGLALVQGKDFVGTGMGGSGTASGELAFVGYSINNGPDGYSSYAPDDDLTGKIAVMFRYEPMDDEGNSLWSSRGPWSGRSSFRGKVRAAADLNPEAIIIINTPGANDPRVDALDAPGGSYVDIPVLMMSSDAARRFFAATSDKSVEQLRDSANAGGGVIDLRGQASVSTTIERKIQYAENVGALIRGKGNLADEYIIVGAHLDHLGMGYFGSRSGPGELHPGADDNASGSAGILLFGKKLAESYEALPADANARSVLFIAFDAEESGLNGARYYSDNPIVPLDKHPLMINFDMIGRVVDGRLSVSGSTTGEGMSEWLQPYYEASPLTVVQPARVASNSDHAAFFRKEIPVLFAIIADFHDDYHTPRDTVDKLNRVATVATIDLFHAIVLDFAQLPEAFPFVNPNAPRPRPQQSEGPGLADIKVRFGVVPATYDDTGDPGIPIRVVSEGGSAEKAGLKAGDLMTEWNGTKIESMLGWMEMLAQHDPGDIVYVTVIRDGEEKAIKVTLQAKGNAGG